MTKSRIKVDICLQSPGKRAGDVLLRWSDNANPLGVYPGPVACIVGKPGPTALLVAGVHGDEFDRANCELLQLRFRLTLHVMC